MSRTKRINVLVYAGTGASVSSVRHTTWSLRRLLGPNHAVLTVTGEQILKEPWATSCALLVMPGGADLGYCRVLNGEGNRRIRDFVTAGGKYLGFCAGGYYGSASCEFEVGRKEMEVIGERELAFWPGICRGLAFKGFVYGSEAGARAVELKVHGDKFTSNQSLTLGTTFRSYYNGGGVFVDAETHAQEGLEVLASYTDDLDVDSGKAKTNAAVIYCRVGEGAAILTGPHPEYSGVNLDRNEPTNPKYSELVDALLAADADRTAFMRACLHKLGLEVTSEPHAVPSLSPLHLSCAQPSVIAELLESLRGAGVLVTDAKDQREYIRGENDTFLIEDVDNRWGGLDSIKQAIDSVLPSSANTTTEPDRIIDYNALTKHLVPHTSKLPPLKETPHFNHALFFDTLRSLHHQNRAQCLNDDYGRVILYGEVVTSTNTLLEKNPLLLSHLPIGTTAVATTQVAGRGRGSNVWVSPPGSLIFSVVQRHSLSLSSRAPVVFVQYLAALAIVHAIRHYRKGYHVLPVKLKWPNDIYALDTPSAGKEEAWVKIGGILISTSYTAGEYTLTTGIGLNVNNPRGPSTSLSALASHYSLKDGFENEILLAGILAQFEALYTKFCYTGWDARLEEMYSAAWLHSGQVVTLDEDAVGNRDGKQVTVRIDGITRDWGQLLAEEVEPVGSDDGEVAYRSTGRRFELQSDSNSFDFLKGLVRRKI